MKKLLNAVDLSRAYRFNPIDVQVINGQAYACDERSWNGEEYDAWQLDEDYKVVNECRVCRAFKEIEKEEIPEDILEDLKVDGDIIPDFNSDEDIDYGCYEDNYGNLRYYKYFFEVRH